MILPVRKSNRMQGYDYTSGGCYFVTICTDDRIHYFGTIIDAAMHLSDAGQVAYDCRSQISSIYRYAVDIDTFVIMPNHIHGIIITNGLGPSLSTIIKGYKQKCSKMIHMIDPSFAWQKSFHDHIIRNQAEYDRIAYYIRV